MNSKMMNRKFEMFSAFFISDAHHLGIVCCKFLCYWWLLAKPEKSIKSRFYWPEPAGWSCTLEPWRISFLEMLLSLPRHSVFSRPAFHHIRSMQDAGNTTNNNKIHQRRKCLELHMATHELHGSGAWEEIPFFFGRRREELEALWEHMEIP